MRRIASVAVKESREIIRDRLLKERIEDNFAGGHRDGHGAFLALGH